MAGIIFSFAISEIDCSTQNLQSTCINLGRRQRSAKIDSPDPLLVQLPRRLPLYLYQPWLPVSIIVKMYNCECIVWDSLEKADDVSAESFEQFPQPIPAELLFDGSDCCARTESELTLPSSKISLNFISEWQKLKLPASNDGSFGLCSFICY